MNVDPILLQEDLWKIVLHNYETKARIGAYEDERGAPQRLRLKAAVYVRRRSALDARIEDVYNYDRIIESIEAVLSEGHVDLQETLIEKISERLFEDDSVKYVYLRSEKTEAYAQAEFVGVEAFFKKKQKGN